SKEFSIPFNLVITKKITVPEYPEVAIGAIAPDGTHEINDRVYSHLNLTEKDFEDAKERALYKVKKRLEKYCNGKEPNVKSKNVIIIDDGIATGFTAIVAGKYVNNNGAKTATLAIPVCPANDKEELEKIYNEVLCYHRAKTFRFAVGAFYKDFHQNTDEELFDYLEKAKEEKILYES
ncbi:MAG: phosphoribosyltransferase, partial [Candidatus Lokiarchaeota archaeon]|nr:phosphoribosyltransferase [Candidatus Lokiarchaeota archaeon]MBD3339715.1 phosphoribosyltransferase [Candidatus Lokiarchaeota archaeon]